MELTKSERLFAWPGWFQVVRALVVTVFNIHRTVNLGSLLLYLCDLLAVLILTVGHHFGKTIPYSFSDRSDLLGLLKQALHFFFQYRHPFLTSLVGHTFVLLVSAFAKASA